MKLGVVSDIHCNLAALEEALRLMGDVDELLCLGDCIRQSKFSNEVIGLLKDRGARMVLGNHDVDYLRHLANASSQRGVVDDALVDWLRAQPEQVELEVAGKRLIMVHSTPWTRDYVYPASRDMRRFAEVDADFVLGGHTHAQVARRIGRAMVVNPGSTGETMQGPDGLRFGCAVIDVATDGVELLLYPEQGRT